MKLGCHIKISGGIIKAVDRASERGCETMQIFVSNPRGWKHSDMPPGDVDLFRTRCEEENINPVFVHTIYLINLAARDDDIWDRSIRSLVMNMEAAARLGSAAVVTHLGSHGGEGEGFGIERVIRAIEIALSRCGDCVPILLETTAGSGNSVGHTFAQLGSILRAFTGDERLGLCFDTCHAFAAGYELRTLRGLDETMEELDREVGLERLWLVHANDSKGDRGSRLDRHQHIGQGMLGLEAFGHMVNHPALGGLPWILETPEMTSEWDQENLQRIRSLVHKE
jgi:deoxyribonuclease-4